MIVSVIASLAGGALRVSRLGAGEKKRESKFVVSLSAPLLRSSSPPTGSSQKPKDGALKHFTHQSETNTHRRAEPQGWTAVKPTNKGQHNTCNTVYILQVTNPESPKY